MLPAPVILAENTFRAPPHHVVTTDVCWNCGGQLTIEVVSDADLAIATHERHFKATHSEPTCQMWRDGEIDAIVWTNQDGRKERLSVHRVHAHG